MYSRLKPPASSRGGGGDSYNFMFYLLRNDDNEGDCREVPEQRGRTTSDVYRYPDDHQDPV